MFIERRKTMRRQADRDLLARFDEAQQRSTGDMSREQRHLRRRAIRHSCQASIALRVATSYGGADTWTLSEQPIPGRLIDLSVDGCSIFSPNQMDIGDRLGLTINLLKGQPIQCLGVVRWTKAIVARNGYANGVQFTEVSIENQSKIDGFLKEVEAKIGLRPD